MSSSEAVRIIALCIALASTETLHGIVRNVFLAPRIGKTLATKLSIVSGTLLAFLVCYLLVPDIGLSGFLPHLYLGMVVAAFMAAFDIAFGKPVPRFKWRRIWQDFNPASGNYLSFGLLALVFIPSLVWWLRLGSV